MPSKSKEKAEEKTIPTKCNVILHHSSFNKLSGGEHNHKETKQTQRDTKGPTFENPKNCNPTTAAELTRCDQEFSGSEPSPNYLSKISIRCIY